MLYQKVTPIEEVVPDLDTLEPHTMDKNHDQMKISKRYIRSKSVLHPNSGMLQDHMELERPPASNVVVNDIEMPSFQPEILNCPDVYFHIQSCPICKKFYKQDNTTYLVIIFILVVICIILFKQLLFS